MFKNLKILTNNNQWNIDFGNNALIHSDGKNSMGKTTVIRSIIYGLGLIKTPNYVDGTHIKDLKVELVINIDKNIYKFSRENEKLIIDIKKNNDDRKRKEFFEIKLQKDIIVVMSFLSQNIFGGKIELLKAALFSNYIDQQYGSHVINRGKIEVFSKELQFNVNDFANEFNEDLKKIEILQNKRNTIKKYQTELLFIKKHGKIKKSQIGLLDLIGDDIDKINDIKEKILIIKKIKKMKKNEKNILKFFSHNLIGLNLVYKNDRDEYKPLTINNFSESLDIKNSQTDIEIKKLENELKRLNEELSLKRVSELDVNSMIKMTRTKKAILNLEALKVDINENDFKKWKNAKNVTDMEIEEMQNKINVEMWIKLEDSVIRYLNEFAKINVSLAPLVTKIEELKNIFIKNDSRFTTYVGAIRFAISSSFKFAISDFIQEMGVEWPIIIDNLFQEELDEGMKNKYIELLLRRKEQKIIASLNITNFAKKNGWIIEEVSRNIFENKNIDLFSTFE